MSKFKPGPAERFPKGWKVDDLKAWYMKNIPDYRKKFKKEKDNGNNDDR